MVNLKKLWTCLRRSCNNNDAAGVTNQQTFSEAAQLRIELANTYDLVADLKETLQRERYQQEFLLKEKLDFALQEFFAALSRPATQLLLVEHQLQSTQNALEAAEVLQFSVKLLEVMNDRGLDFIGRPDQIYSYDPLVHDLIETSNTLTCLDLVRVKVPGARYNDFVLKKALVVPAKVEGAPE